MKKLYKLLFLGVFLILFCYSANAQYRTLLSRPTVEHDQYGDPISSSIAVPRSTATRTPSNRTSTTSNTEENPFDFDITFNNINVLLTMQGLIAAAQRRAVEKWLGEQEETFRNEINRQLGTNHTTFKNAQRDFFKNYEKNFKRIEETARDIAFSHVNKARTLDKEQEQYTMDFKLLEVWKPLYDACGPRGNVDCGDSYVVRGRPLRTASKATLDQLWEDTLEDFSKKEYEAALNQSWAQGVYKIVDDGSLTSEMVDKHIIYYNQRNLEDKVFLMTAYLVQHYNRYSGQIAIPIAAYSIPNIWDNPRLLELGKENALSLPEKYRVFDGNYILNQAERAIYTGGNAERTYNRLMNLRESIIEDHIGTVETRPFFVEEDFSNKVNPKLETKCFDTTKPAKITIYVEQPIANSRKITADIGHTFIGIEQGEISRYLGFYPDSPGATLVGDKSQPAEIRDNSGSPFDVSISITVSPGQLTQIIGDINSFPELYMLEEYNCSDFGIQIGNKAGLSIPATVGKYSNFIFKFEGRNPADLGQDIRQMKESENIKINTKGGSAPKKKGKC